jgi:hypothetical protein
MIHVQIYLFLHVMKKREIQRDEDIDVDFQISSHRVNVDFWELMGIPSMTLIWINLVKKMQKFFFGTSIFSKCIFRKLHGGRVQCWARE